MPKYMIHSRYTAEGAKGLLKEGGTGRRKVAEDVVKQLGGKVEAFYYAFGDDDVFILIDVPDNASAAAASLVASSTGAIHAKITVLMTPEELDAVAAKTVTAYRPPGK
jgi:uncharacterized protein with GYD domain